MAGDLTKKTMEGMTNLRCMLVGLGDEQADLCSTALVPISMVRVDGVKEACARMSTVLPLMVVASSGLGSALLAELGDVAQTCAAEILVVDGGTRGRALIDRLHETLRRADLRRMRADRRDD